MKKNIVIVVLLVVALLLAGTVGYLIAEKIVSNKYENGSTNNNDENNNKNNNAEENSEVGEVKNLSLSEDLVTSLVYPNDVTKSTNEYNWNYKNETIESLGRDKMMRNAAYGLNYSSLAYSEEHYSAEEIRNNFIRIFGPDTVYSDGDLTNGGFCEISKYDSDRNIYIAYAGCGGASIGYIDRVSKKYRAAQSGDNIYVYEYVQSVLVGPSDTDPMKTIVYLIGHSDTWSDINSSNKETKYLVLNGADKSNYENLIYQMMDRGEVDTYKWTFKKQSDGKYYFYSGAWEN